jgi:hypothetical protein
MRSSTPHYGSNVYRLWQIYNSLIFSYLYSLKDGGFIPGETFFSICLF